MKLADRKLHYTWHCLLILLSDRVRLYPTGHVMHQQFNIQQLYVLPALSLCVL